jgi:hypothetical protein
VLGSFPDSYELALTPTIKSGTVTVKVPPGVRIYSFTFG